MSVVRIGIIGVGVMGSAHVNSVKQLKNCELTALCDIDPKALERHRESARSCSPTVRRFLHREKWTASLFPRLIISMSRLL